MRLFTSLHLDEVSIVGEGFEPKNPAAKAVLYKAGRKGEGMADTSAAAAVKQVVDFVKGWARNYQSTETFEEVPTMAGGVTQGQTAAAEPSAPVQQGVAAPVPPSAPAVDMAAVVTQAVQAAIEPVRQSVAAMDSRLAAVEGRPVGSAAVDKAARLPILVSSPLGNLGESFLVQAKQQLNVARLTKATITSGNWTVGLKEKAAKEFIDFEVDQSALLKEIRQHNMEARMENIPKLLLSTKVLKKGEEAQTPGDTVSVPTPTEVVLNAKEVIAIFTISDRTMTETIEEGQFVTHLLDMIGAAAGNELEEAAIHGDTAVADSYILDRWDGFYKIFKAGGNVIEGMTATNRFWPGAATAKFDELQNALPEKYQFNPNDLRLILSPRLYRNYRTELKKQGSGVAAEVIIGAAAELSIDNVKQIRCPMLKNNMAFTYSSTNYTDGTFTLLTNPRNLILGRFMDIKIEAQRDAPNRQTIFVITQHLDFKVENAAAGSMYDHLKVV